jgi:hypothetical protein
VTVGWKHGGWAPAAVPTAEGVTGRDVSNIVNISSQHPLGVAAGHTLLNIRFVLLLLLLLMLYCVLPGVC